MHLAGAKCGDLYPAVRQHRRHLHRRRALSTTAMHMTSVQITILDDKGESAGDGHHYRCRGAAHTSFVLGTRYTATNNFRGTIQFQGGWPEPDRGDRNSRLADRRLHHYSSHWELNGPNPLH